MTGRLWVLVEGLNVSDPSDELGAEGECNFKTGREYTGWSSGFSIVYVNTAIKFQNKILRIYWTHVELSPSQKNIALCSEFESFNR